LRSRINKNVWDKFDEKRAEKLGNVDNTAEMMSEAQRYHQGFNPDRPVILFILPSNFLYHFF